MIVYTTVDRVVGWVVVRNVSAANLATKINEHKSFGRAGADRIGQSRERDRLPGMFHDAPVHKNGRVDWFARHPLLEVKRKPAKRLSGCSQMKSMKIQASVDVPNSIRECDNLRCAELRAVENVRREAAQWGDEGVHAARTARICNPAPISTHIRYRQSGDHKRRAGGPCDPWAICELDAILVPLKSDYSRASCDHIEGRSTSGAGCRTWLGCDGGSSADRKRRGIACDLYAGRRVCHEAAVTARVIWLDVGDGDLRRAGIGNYRTVGGETVGERRAILSPAVAQRAGARRAHRE